MITLKLKTKVKKDGNITLNIPTKFRAGEIELVIIMNKLSSNTDSEKQKQYNFSKFSNKLNWQGDAVKEQRKLRDEWE